MFSRTLGLLCLLPLLLIVPLLAADAPNERLRALAQQGDVGAQFYLGIWLTMQAPKEERDFPQGAVWLRKAADQNFSRAQFMMAILYEGGLGVTKDLEQAHKWLVKSAENGDSMAQLELSERYETGNGVPKNSAESLTWLRKAADQKDPMAMYNLGFRYTRGEGVAKDINEGLKWILLSAEAGDAKAQFNIGSRYAMGVDLPEDRRLGYRWLLMAYKLGDELILRQLQTLRTQLSREEQVKEEEWVMKKKAQLAEEKKQ